MKTHPLAFLGRRNALNPRPRHTLLKHDSHRLFDTFHPNKLRTHSNTPNNCATNTSTTAITNHRTRTVPLRTSTCVPSHAPIMFLTPSTSPSPQKTCVLA